MGRQSDIPFTIFSEATDFATSNPTFRHASPLKTVGEDVRDDTDYTYDSSYQSPTKSQLEEYQTDVDNHESARTSISSLPEALAEDENNLFSKPPYTPTKLNYSNGNRPLHRRSQSDFDGISHTLRPRGSIHLTPRSVRKVQTRASPRPRTKDRQEETDNFTYPLVLLHVTLLPVSLPWSQESLKQVLTKDMLDNLNLLKAKATDAVLQRGILIPHPRDEVDLLEERLLEALELEDERITNCGHFTRQWTTTFDDWSSESEHADSGIGSSRASSRSSDECATCKHRLNSSKTGVSVGDKRWDVKIYAANGLMRSNAWAACWSEMERIDVEIAPWLPENMRKQLDIVRDEAESHIRAKEEKERLRELARREEAVENAEIELRQQQRRRDLELEQAHRLEQRLRSMEAVSPTAQTSPQGRPSMDSTGKRRHVHIDLPQAYRPKEVPLEVLVRNYIYLLAQDRRNIVILILSLLVMFFSFRSWTVNHASLDVALGMCKKLSPGLQTPMVIVQPNTTTFGTGISDESYGLPLGSVAVMTTSDMMHHTAEAVAAAKPSQQPRGQDDVVDLETHFEEMDDLMV